MVVEVVASQVGEYASCVVKTVYAVLVGCMAAYFHGRECASAVDHFGQQGVQPQAGGVVLWASTSRSSILLTTVDSSPALWPSLRAMS